MKLNQIKVSGGVVLAMMIIIVLTPLWSYLIWYFSAPQQIKVLTLDKTVPFEKRDEHISWYWVLNHFKYYKPDGKRYDEKSDYKGFFPYKKDSLSFKIEDLSELSIDEVVSFSDSLDIYYIADTYGVYEHSWHEKKTRPTYSKKIYGGAEMNDFHLAEAMLERDKLVIAESNLLGPPTSRRVRNKFENLFNISWSGWVGKYYSSLDTLRNNEIPMWVTELYHEQYGPDWPFDDGGIILVNKNSQIVILDEEKDLLGNSPIITSSEKTSELYGVNDLVHYPFWFEITNPDPQDSTEVISWFELVCTQKGKELLKVHQIPLKFPAIIKGKDRNFYYLSGDFADNHVDLTKSHFAGVTYLKHFFFLLDEAGISEEFFWEYYVPLMNFILEENFNEPD